MVARVRDFIQRGTTAAKPAATAVDVGTLYFDTDLDKLQRSSGSAWEDVEQAAASGAITTSDAQQGADISLSAATYTNIVSVSLAAGTWDIWGWIDFLASAATGDAYAQLWDGAAQLGQMVSRINVNSSYLTVPVFAGAVVLASTTTIYLRGYTAMASTAKGSTSLGAGGGSKMHAMKIA